ncbi:MAG TPA: hypothetical protein VFA55_01430 [Candidatus Kapabacteria bacterium]|nr:hypothetical protein [Candidatus Kapabacteria bacterium]
MKNSRQRLFLVILAAILSLGMLSCAKKDPQNELLDNFFRDYIKRADAKAALKWAAGDAEKKLQDEMEQVAGQPRPVEMPDISYRIFSSSTETDTALFDLLLTIEEKDAPSFTRELVVSEAKTNDGLKVVDFQFVK